MSEENIFKPMIRGFYDHMHQRTIMGNRICAQFRAKLGLKPQEKEEDNAGAAKILNELRARFKKLTDGVKRELPTMKSFKGDEIISTYAELCLIAQYMEQEVREDAIARRIGALVEDHPLWDAFFKGIVGCGPIMSGVILSEIDIHKCRYPSSLWKYCGYDVQADGRGTSKRKEHLVEVEYTAADGTLKTKLSIRHNPRIKTKMYVLAGCFFKSKNEKYVQIYKDYRHRLEHKPDWQDKTKLNKHMASIRYMMKQFLVDLYKVWRALEGLEVHPPYSEAKLGIFHRADNPLANLRLEPEPGSEEDEVMALAEQAMLEDRAAA